MKTALLFAALAITAHAADDIVLADFEAENYGAWKVEGEAFGPGPARGALPGQMHVEGFAGKGLVNSFFKGDKSKGRLTSPEFKIERRNIAFLIGGGGHDGLRMDLLIEGKAARTATGPNTAPGGSERLEPSGWEVADLAGKTARIVIVDDAGGGWGHINVDQIVLTDRDVPKQAKRIANVTREIGLGKKYLHFPVKTGAKKHRVTVLVAGAVVREFEIELSAEPEWWAHLDVSAWQGKNATLRADWLNEGDESLAKVTAADAIWAADSLYREPLRGQLHWSPRRGWNNDPNGMVWAAGEYHLYFQANPYGWAWGNMHWGHAVSRDLVHWDELPIALYQNGLGDMAFSGSAVVDKANTSGWKKGPNDLLVAAFTSTGRGECIIYSNDLGRTWTEYEGNPVVKHTGRDPRLLWHEPSRQWIMALYSEAEKKQWITFHTSPDLKKWTYRSRVPDFFECPDIFPLPLDGDAAKTKWVLTGASSEYMVGEFDGATFTPGTPKLPGHRGKGFYAAQTFTNEPKGRVIQIGWFQTATPGMPFNQSMSLPNVLSLRTTPEGPRLAWEPAAELVALRGKQIAKMSVPLQPDAPDPLEGVHAELAELRTVIEPRAAAEVVLKLRGIAVSYDAAKRELIVHGHRAPVALRDGKLDLTIYVDRTGLEVFADGGLTYIPMPVNLDPARRGFEIAAKGGAARIVSLELHELKSIWK